MDIQYLRLFYAIRVPDEIKKTLRVAFKGISYDWKPVKEDQMHITLAFMADVPNTDLQLIEGVGELAAKAFPPFPITLKQTGCFPSEHKPRVWFVHTDSDILIDLAQSLLGKLKGYGDEKPFRSHLTLARKREGTKEAPPKKEFTDTWMVKSFDLIQSTLTGTGAIHKVVRVFSLEGS